MDTRKKLVDMYLRTHGNLGEINKEETAFLKELFKCKLNSKFKLNVDIMRESWRKADYILRSKGATKTRLKEDPNYFENMRAKRS